jgi:hypothetical protein
LKWSLVLNAEGYVKLGYSSELLSISIFMEWKFILAEQTEEFQGI